MARPLTDDESLLRDAAHELLADAWSPARRRTGLADVTAADPLWDGLREFVPLGLGPLAELCVLMEELGSVAAPTPFFATACLYAPLLDATGEHDLDPVLDGHATGTVALAGPDGTWRPNASRFKTEVPDATAVDLVAAVDADRTVTLLAGPPCEPMATGDSTRPLFVVDTEGPGRPAGAVSGVALTDLLDRARVALAAETVGTVRGLLDRVDAAADLGPALGHARALVVAAADALDAGSAGRARATALARDAVRTLAARAATAAGPGAGSGPGRDADLGLLVRRARSSPAWLGAGRAPHRPGAGTSAGTTI